MTTIYTLTLQPGPGGVTDTFLDSQFPTVNFAGEGMLGAGDQSGGTAVERTLITFSLSALPAGAQIVSATLSLFLQYNFANNARTFRVFRVKRAWKLADATWNNYAAGQAWQTAG